MNRRVQRRYPFPPILTALKVDVGPLGGWKRPGDDSLVGMTGLIEVLGVSHSTLYRWARNGVPETEADRIACHILDTHPSLIWAEWYDQPEQDTAA